MEEKEEILSAFAYHRGFSGELISFYYSLDRDKEAEPLYLETEFPDVSRVLWKSVA